MSNVATMSERLDRQKVVHIHFPAHDDWLTRDELDAMTPQKLIENVRALKPLIAAHALDAERARRPSDVVWKALRRTGAMYHFVPKRYGGLEYDLETFVDYVSIIGEACASTAWSFGQCVEHNWGFALYPKQAQDEIFGEFPYICCPGVTTPPGEARMVDGGYVVTGHWKWGSGVMNADWIKGGVIERDADGKSGRHLQVIFPASEATILDTWIADGMCATGSNDIVVRDIFVPAHRAIDMGEWMAGRSAGAATHESAIYKLPMISFLSLTTMIPAVGAARGALAFFGDYQKERMVWGTDKKKIDNPSAQMRLARARLKIDAADLLLRDTARQMMDIARSNQVAAFEPRARIRAQNNYAMELCREAVTTLCEGAGATAHLLTNPLQRALRDINVMASHVLYEWDGSTETLGRAMLGLEPNSMIW